MRVVRIAPDLCDVIVTDAVTIRLALTDYQNPGVWSVVIDGVEYREPRDLTDEPLSQTPFRWKVEQAIERHLEDERKRMENPPAR